MHICYALNAVLLNVWCNARGSMYVISEVCLSATNLLAL